MASGTLDANDETFTVLVQPGMSAAVSLDIDSTITVTATVGGGIAFEKSPGVAAAWTESSHFAIDVPGEYTFTASGVSGGTCDYTAVSYGRTS